MSLHIFRFAATKDSYREVANLFNTTISAVYRNSVNFMEFLCDISEEHIKFPESNAEKIEKSRTFAKIKNLLNII